MLGRVSNHLIPQGRSLTDLSVLPLYQEKFCIVEGTKEEPAKYASYEDLTNRKWILTHRTSSLRQQLTDFLRKGLQLPEPVVITSNYMQSMAVVAGSNLCTVVPQSAASLHARLGVVRVLATPDEITPMPVSFITLASSNQVPLLEKFQQVVQRAVLTDT